MVQWPLLEVRSRRLLVSQMGRVSYGNLGWDWTQVKEMVPKQRVRWGRRNSRNQRAWWQSAPSCFPWATLRSWGWFQQRTLANLTHPCGVKAEATAESRHEQQPPMLAESSLSDSMQIGASLSWHLCCLASHIKLWVQNLSCSLTVFLHTWYSYMRP